MDARVAEHVDRDLALRTIGERREQRPAEQAAVVGIEAQRGIDADDRFVPAVGMFDSRDHLGLRETRGCIAEEVQMQRVPGTIGALEQRRAPDHHEAHAGRDPRREFSTSGAGRPTS